MTTTNKGLALPTLNEPNWNDPLNENFTIIDTTLGGTYSRNVTADPVTNLLTVENCSNLILSFSGTAVTGLRFNIPAGVGGSWIVVNGTDKEILIGNATGGSATVAVPVSGRRTVYSNGTNAYLADNSISAIGSANTVIYNDGSKLTGTAGLTYDGTSLTVTPTVATTAAAVEAMRLDAQSSGTPAAGFGTALVMAAESPSSGTLVGGRIETILSDVTASTEDFDFLVKLMKDGAAAAEKLRVKSDGTLIQQGAVWSDNFKAKDGTDTAKINGITPIAAADVPTYSTSMTLLGTINTPSGSGNSVSLSSLVLTGYKMLLFLFNGVATTGGSSANRKVGTVPVSALTNASAMYGLVYVPLATGRAWGVVSPDNNDTSSMRFGNTGYSTATTSVSVATDAAFAGGSVLVYGVK